ncbi:hypothetical protein [Roseburia sp. 499]|uniref:hypothetical protein n=1 Tax=Roseburia sp. 499 TaxID=1261634 RepID=UPI000952648C|nr:hypothetical protein [Roseburia sp. 499]WVK69498.1 hypothetical protein BIV20_14220 [Roseburia sp. 499]
MKALKIGGLALVIASSLLFSGCGCGNAKTTEKEVAIATETKDTKENKIDEKVSDETQTQVASGETEVKEDTKDSKGTEEKSDKSDKTEKSDSTDNSGSTGNTGNSGNGGSSNSGNSGNHSGNTGNTGSTSHTPIPAPSNGGGNSSGGTSSTTPTHTHNWIPITQTIHHPAETRQEDHGHYETVVDEPAWDEEETDVDVICFTCYNRNGSIVRIHGQEEANNHALYHANTYGEGCRWGDKEFSTGNTIHHEAVTHQEWVSNIVTVTVKEAWDEVVTVGYQCSECGATK